MSRRAATPADRVALAELVLRCDESYRDWAGAQLRVPTRDEELAHWHRRFADPQTRVRVEERDGEIVGVVAWTQARAQHFVGPAIDGRAHVSAVFVDPDHWRQGIAASLLDAALAEMRAAGFTSAQLWTPVGAPARVFYEAQGWRVADRTQHMPELNLPLVMYQREL